MGQLLEQSNQFIATEGKYTVFAGVGSVEYTATVYRGCRPDKSCYYGWIKDNKRAEDRAMICFGDSMVGVHIVGDLILLAFAVIVVLLVIFAARRLRRYLTRNQR
jgi:hypothetical protein